ncbi:MAG: DUF2442 domain-containing protein [Chromatiales bacterium]|nr:DUF2442 domain-containing protein [Chromatiales bacterium]
MSLEVTNISAHGVWLFAHGEELFVSYDDFPWFREMAVKSIVNVEEQSPDHFYWPDLDVDLTGEIIKHPVRFPLKSRST